VDTVGTVDSKDSTTFQSGAGITFVICKTEAVVQIDILDILIIDIDILIIDSSCCR